MSNGTLHKPLRMCGSIKVGLFVKLVCMPSFGSLPRSMFYHIPKGLKTPYAYRDLVYVQILGQTQGWSMKIETQKHLGSPTAHFV